jgi:restriction system protein
MPNRQSSFAEDVFELLMLTPPWVGPVLAGLSYVFFRYLLPFLVSLFGSPRVDLSTSLRSLYSMLGLFFALCILIGWAGAELRKFLDRRILDTRSSVGSLNDISWEDFENLVGEAYRRQGYSSRVVGNSFGDGGVDIELSKPGKTILVQCKQWRTRNVRVNVVREMLGVVVNRRAQEGIVVTSGRFTQEAIQFAQTCEPRIQLIDGTELFELIRFVQKSPATINHTESSPNTGMPANEVVPHCPQCGRPMVRRVARQGRHSGSSFWGCSSYPRCNGKIT